MTLHLRSIPVLSILCLTLATMSCQGNEAQPTSSQERESVKNALDLYMEGLISADADRIPLSQDVLFVGPDGSSESTFKGIGDVSALIEKQSVDDIRVRQTVIDGEYGCNLTNFHWTGGPEMPIALCLRVVGEEITEIRPYFDRTLFEDD